jgi:RNA polymerase sigma-70 factor (ECF subfamily)
LDDPELVAKARAGDNSAFAALVGRYEARILRLVRGMVPASDTEDVTQEAFLKAFRKLDRFDGRSSFYTWLYRIAANTAMDWNKKERRRRHLPLPEAPDGGDMLPGRGAGPAREASQHELGRRIDEAIAALPPKYLEIITLREVEGLSYEEIARVLDISKGTVESRLFRARERLRDRLRSWV